MLLHFYHLHTEVPHCAAPCTKSEQTEHFPPQKLTIQARRQQKWRRGRREVMGKPQPGGSHLLPRHGRHKGLHEFVQVMKRMWHGPKWGIWLKNKINWWSQVCWGDLYCPPGLPWEVRTHGHQALGKEREGKETNTGEIWGNIENWLLELSEITIHSFYQTFGQSALFSNHFEPRTFGTL